MSSYLTPIPLPTFRQLLQGGYTTEFLIYTQRRKTQKEVRMTVAAMAGWGGGSMEPNKQQKKRGPLSSHKTHNCEEDKMCFSVVIVSSSLQSLSPQSFTMIRSKDGIDDLFFFPYLWGHRLIQNLKEHWIPHTEKIIYRLLIFIITSIQEYCIIQITVYTAMFSVQKFIPPPPPTQLKNKR